MNATQLQTIHVLIADDHNLILEIVALALEDAADIVLTTANSVAEVDQHLSSHGPFTLILLDLDMPGMSGTKTVAEVMARNAGQPVGVFTGAPSDRVVEELRSLGGAGIIPKSCSMRSLTDAIRIMSTGEAYYDLVAPPEIGPLPPSGYAH